MLQGYILILCVLNSNSVVRTQSLEKAKDLEGHSYASSNKIFPYVAAILSKSVYIGAGALVDETWVLTAADALFLMSESLRTLRVRVGSINNMKGGFLIPVMYFEIHPYFDDRNPDFDIALIRLSHPVRITPYLYPIKLLMRTRPVTTTHFIVTSWPTPDSPRKAPRNHIESMEVIKRRRLMITSHLHPTDFTVCEEELKKLEINNTKPIMCLDSKISTDFCERDAGAPVVLNGVLWGIISSWRPADCTDYAWPTIVTLVSDSNVSSWIHSTIRGHRWTHKEIVHRNDYSIEIPKRNYFNHV